MGRANPPFDPWLDKAEELLADFGRVWEVEEDPAKRRRLLATLFDRVWQDGGTIVVVKPREAFLRYFQTADELARRREKKRGVESGSDGAEPAESFEDTRTTSPHLDGFRVKHDTELVSRGRSSLARSAVALRGGACATKLQTP